MSVKKLALLGVASVATLGMGVSLAGGPAHHQSHHDSGLYAGFDFGAKYNTTLDKTVAEWDLVDDDDGGIVAAVDVVVVADSGMIEDDCMVVAAPS